MWGLVLNISFLQQAVIPSCPGAAFPPTSLSVCHLDRVSNGHHSSIPTMCHVPPAQPNAVEHLWRLDQDCAVALANVLVLLGSASSSPGPQTVSGLLCMVGSSSWKNMMEQNRKVPMYEMSIAL